MLIMLNKVSHIAAISISPAVIKGIRKEDVKGVFSVGVPSAALTGLFDLANIVLNAQMSIHGDLPLAAVGIVMKAERLPNAINVGICQGICHQEGYRRGIASNHADVLHWFPGMGKSMDDFRRDVAAAMKPQPVPNDEPKKEEDDEMLTYEQWKAYMERYRKELRDNDSSEWSQKARQFAVEHGIFAGGGTAEDGAPNYMWEDLMTREQCAQVLYAFATKFELA